MKYAVDSRTIWFLALYGVLGLIAFGAGAFLAVRGVVKERRAVVVIQRADSLIADWVSRGCAPRTKALP